MGDRNVAPKTAEDLVKTLYDIYDTSDRFNVCNGNDFEEIFTSKKWQSEDYKIKLVDRCGGEGQGDDYWIVFEINNLVTNEISLIEFDCFYDSYNGCSWDNLPYYVTPREKTIVVFEPL